MDVRGIDVSHWNGKIDWPRVAASGVRFVMVKIAEGDGRGGLWTYDETDRYIRGAIAAGLDVGAYIYAKATDVPTAAREAQATIKLLEPYAGMLAYPIAYDVEEGIHAALSTIGLTRVCDAYCDALRAAGWYPMIYMSESWLRSEVRPEDVSADAWCAQWGDRCGYKQSKMWQYAVLGTASDVKAGLATRIGSVPGVPGRCDMDVCYVDYPEIIRGQNYNGYKGGFGMTCKTLNDVPAGEFRETVRRLMEADVLKGDGAGNINLPYEIVRQYVVLRRAGVFEGVGVGREA